MRLGSALRAVAIAVVSVMPAACSTGGEPGGGDVTRLRVLAAASLTEVLTELVPVFEEERDRVEVELSFGASSSLAQQVNEGATADVLVTADERTMAVVRDAGNVVGEPSVIARNRLTVLVEHGNPRGIAAIDDLDRDGLSVVVCAPEAPCGALAAALLDAAGVRLRPASLEENVKGVVAKVTLGEADAGIVYETDARAVAPDADTVALPLADDERFEAVYPAAVLAASAARSMATGFVEFLTSAEAVEAFREAGFRSP